MKRLELAHLLRAACNITGDPDVLVIGSQAILGTFDEDDLPPAATASVEADIALLDDPDRLKADDVEGAIGEMSTFHQHQGIYAEGVHINTAKFLPQGWRGRLISWPLQSSHPAEPHFLEPHVWRSPSSAPPARRIWSSSTPLSELVSSIWRRCTRGVAC